MQLTIVGDNFTYGVTAGCLAQDEQTFRVTWYNRSGGLVTNYYCIGYWK